MEKIMRKKPWFFKNGTGLGIFGVVLVFGMMAAGCPTVNDDPPPAKTCTVTFNVDGGNAIEDQTVDEGKPVTKPADPTKAGNTFAGWYKDAAKTVLWNFETDVVVADITLYAKWVAGENLPHHTVTFNADGGSPTPAEQSVVQGEPVAKPPDPDKQGYLFDGWINTDTGNTWNFATDKVSKDITLKAKWDRAVTITFETNGGSATDPVTVAAGSDIDPNDYPQPSKAGNVFEGWYTDEELTTSAGSPMKITENTILYAKWTSYAGVWQSNDTENNRSYWLQDDGTAWVFSVSSGSFEFSRTSWSTSRIGEDTVAFNDDKTQFTLNDSTYIKNTTNKKTPAAATGGLLGTWRNESWSIELKNNGEAVLKVDSDSVTLKYCAETNAVYLLTPDNNLVIASITVSGGELDGFSKQTNDSALAGIWKLTENGQDYYWELKADGSGTFHALGASVSFSFAVTEDEKIDERHYEVSGNGKILNFPDRNVTLNKVDSVPSGLKLEAGGDSRLYGMWKPTQEEGVPIIMTFNPTGVLEQSVDGEKIGQAVIWKADGKIFYMYSPGFSSFEGDGGTPYGVSGSTLTIEIGDEDMTYTKQ
jgi:uncharacterized repeat protein (TIGR02543 family)